MSRRWVATCVATLLLALIGCGQDGALVDASTASIDAPPSQGRIALAWTLFDGPTPVSCAAVGASTIRVAALPDPGVFAEVDALSCGAGMGETRLLEAGRYDVTVELRAGGAAIGEVRFDDIEIVGGETLDLGAAEFAVTATGTLMFRLGSDTADSLCANTGAGTLGLEGVVLALRDDVAACTATDFTIAAGATLPAGTYSADCVAAFACIESDQQIVAHGVRAGQRSLDARGWIGGLPCWWTTVGFSMPGNDQTADLGVISLEPDTTVAGCPGAPPSQ